MTPAGTSTTVYRPAKKVYQDFHLEVINPGGHSSRPVTDNAINRLARALGRVADHTFPYEFTDTTRTFLIACRASKAARQLLICRRFC